MNPPQPLSPGQSAPDFPYRDARGQEGHTRDLRGSSYLVYFYPRDNTPGCTTEACAFRDQYAAFKRAGLPVIGVSADSEESHEKFRRKHDLPFALTADPDLVTIRAFGVWGKKKFMGREFEGIHRMSFLVGPDGIIRKTYPKVKPAEHAEEVLRDAQELR